MNDSWPASHASGPLLESKPEQEDIAVLVRRARANKVAFSEIYMRYHRQVFQYLRLRCQNSEETSDLTQQVFLQALTKLGTYRDRGVPFIAWLMRITRNAAIDASRRRRESLSWDMVPEVHLSQDDANPETAALDGDLLSRLRELIAGLDAEKRDLLALRFSAGLSAREIGLVVGKSEAAVQKQVRRTLELLKENLDAE